ncbi:MAG: hypothetical protein LH615_09380 [Ferruginibacter sp.]|nr:hypothetical protein [Ferruginibacter sp.]
MDKNIIIPEEEQTDNKGNEPVVLNDSKKTEEENEKERSFKEGLANNSDTDNNSTQQK